MNVSRIVMMSSSSKIAVAALAALAACAGGPGIEAEPLPDAPAAQAAAPDPTQETAGSQRDEPAGALYDDVLAIVGANVVTKSAVRNGVEEQLAITLRELRKKQPSARLVDDDVRGVELMLARQRVQSLLLADHVDMLGIDPELIKRHVDSELDASVQRKEAEAGGSQINLLRRLEAQGKTYKQFIDEERARIRQGIAYWSERQKADLNSPLLATPRDLLLYYRSHREEFAIPAKSVLTLLRFEPKESAPPPATRAAAARSRLEAEEELKAVVAATGATAETITLSPDENRPEFLKRFAFGDAKVGAVSDPIERPGGEVLLLRLDGRTSAGVRPFVDEAVQREIREKISNQRWREILERIDRAERRRVQVWPRDLFRR